MALKKCNLTDFVRPDVGRSIVVSALDSVGTDRFNSNFYHIDENGVSFISFSIGPRFVSKNICGTKMINNLGEKCVLFDRFVNIAAPHNRNLKIVDKSFVHENQTLDVSDILFSVLLDFNCRFDFSYRYNLLHLSSIRFPGPEALSETNFSREDYINKLGW
jgi:hypothetical protein